MKDKALSDVVAGVRSQPPLRRSDLYRWLRARHRALSKLLADQNPSWIVVADKVAAAGVTNTRGGAPSADSVRRVWACVVKDIEAEAKRKVGSKVQPSRLSNDWRPTPAATPRPSPAARPIPFNNTVSTPAAPRELTEEARATLAALDAQLDYRDRFVNPPKRKD